MKEKNNQLWDDSNIKLFIFTMEHFIIMFVLIFEAVISDVPHDIQKLEI